MNKKGTVGLISYKMERIIFIIIFILILTFAAYINSVIKLDCLGLNIGLTPEQVIENTLGKKSGGYLYKVEGNSLFVLYPSGFDVAFKNKNTGYLFKIPGMIYFNFGTSWNTCIIPLPDKKSVFLTVRKRNNTYAIQLHAFDRNEGDIEFYDNQGKLDKMELDNYPPFKHISMWVQSVDGIADNYQIYGICNGQKVEVVDASEIKRLSGEK